MTDEQVRHMVDRFLAWRLPDNFKPDGGVSFAPIGNAGTPHEYRRQPVGTNLLTAAQTEEMVCHLVEGLPKTATEDRLGAWLSAALDDPNVCAEMKADIRAWFSAHEAVAAMEAG